MHFIPLNSNIIFQGMGFPGGSVVKNTSARGDINLEASCNYKKE